MGVFKALLLAGCAGTIMLATPAMAQDDGDILAEEDDDGPAIVVTGSRIARPDFNSNSPAVTADEALLENSATSALEVNLNKLPQFVPAQTPTAGGDIQPTATNTPGAATISLRGIGANRTLVLLDGRRSTPSNASGVTDISTIPSAAIERVEIISGGASATYGADAVAGVTNFILKKNFQGLELDGRLGITQEGDGFEYQVSGIMGADFDDGRGNVSLALSVNTREANFQRDRDWYADRYTDPNVGGNQFFIDRPAIQFSTFNPFNDAARQAVFPGTCAPPQGVVPTPSCSVSGGSLVYANLDGSAFTADFNNRGGVPFFNTGALNGFPYKIAATGAISQNNTNLYLILPLTRYNAFARGNYEINDWVGIFGQALFSHVNTYTRNEPGPITGGWGVDIPWGTGVYTGGPYQGLTNSNLSSVIRNGELLNFVPYVDPTPTVLTDNPNNPAFGQRYAGFLGCGAAGGVGGCSNTQVFQQVIPQELQILLNGRTNPNANFDLVALMPDDRETFTDVMTYNITAGLEGSIPSTDWTWEAFVNHGESHTFALQTGIYSLNRVRSVITSPNFGQNFQQQGNPNDNGFGASTGACTTGYNFFAQNYPNNISANCTEAISADLKNRSKFRQTIVEANLQGGLFDLPAGQLRMALGASYREMDYEFLNDTLTTQGRSFQDQALGIYPSGNSRGFIDVKEVYGELLIPVLADIPFIQELNLEVGGRMSNYSTTGTSYTYKALADWSVTDWLRFRGGFNKAERAPNIGELFLAPQQTFGVNTAGDVCSRGNPNTYSANQVGVSNQGVPNGADTTGNALGLNVELMCRALMNQRDPSGNTAINFYGGPGGANPAASGGSASTATFGFAFPTTIGNPNLTPESAKTWTAGVVINSPFASGPLSRLRMSVDWFKIRVEDAIGIQSIGVAQRQCFDPLFNPLVTGATTAAGADAAIANPFCANIIRNIPDGNLGNVQVTYANNGRFEIQGIDAQIDWGMDVGPGTLTVNLVGNYLLDYLVAELPTDPMVEYVGTQGTGVNGLNGGGSYEYRLLTSVGYGIGPARVSLQWQHYAAVEDSAEAILGPTPTTGPPAYNLFNLNASYQVTEDIGLRFGVDNLFNKAPPVIGINATNNPALGQLPGGNLAGGVYDTVGRRFYLGGNVRF